MEFSKIVEHPAQEFGLLAFGVNAVEFTVNEVFEELVQLLLFDRFTGRDPPEVRLFESGAPKSSNGLSAYSCSQCAAEAQKSIPCCIPVFAVS